MIADPWAQQATTSPWGNPVDTVTTNQPDMWSARRSPSPGQIAAHVSVFYCEKHRLHWHSRSEVNVLCTILTSVNDNQLLITYML